MKQKGSKYARKHRQLLTGEEKTVAQKPEVEKDSDIWDILYNPHHFMKKFLELPYPRQIAMVKLLHDICEKKDKMSLSPLEQEFSHEAGRHLEAIFEQTNSSYDTGTYYSLSKEEKRLVRMECYGTINQRLPHQLSMFYNFFSRPENRGKFKLKEYNLEASPSWRVFNQFESFRSIAPQIRRSLYRQGINPDALKVLTVSDYCDVIYQTFKKDDRDMSAYFLKPEKAIKNRMVMDFMKKCGDVFEHRLLEQGNDPRCVRSLCNMMKRYGICDLNTLIVTETHYTPRILQDLSKAGYDISDCNINEPIAQTFVDTLIDEDKGYLLLARNPDGTPLSKEGLPQLEYHHKNAVKFAAHGGYLAKVNYPNNYLLVDSQMHQNYFHLFDKIIEENKMQKFYSRLNVNSRQMCLALGFQLDDAVYCDFEDTPSFRRRQEKDKQCRVNYFKMMEERLQNEQEIAEKYHISYTKNGISSANSVLKEMAGQPNYDKEKMKIFQNWLNSHRKSRKGK